MIASNKFKGLLAGVATVAVVGVAMAQGTPPNPNTTNAPMGAGQQSTQETPMGTTGTPAGGGATAAGSSSGTMGSSTDTGSGSTSSGSTMGATGGTTDATTMGADTSRPMRADRN